MDMLLLRHRLRGKQTTLCQRRVSIASLHEWKYGNKIHAADIEGVIHDVNTEISTHRDWSSVPPAG